MSILKYCKPVYPSLPDLSGHPLMDLTYTASSRVLLRPVCMFGDGGKLLINVIAITKLLANYWPPFSSHINLHLDVFFSNGERKCSCLITV